MVVKAYVWYDKVDKTYLSDACVMHRSERSVCRGFLNEFKRDDKMNQNEYDLYCIGIFDDESGVFTPENPPRLVNVMQVYADIPNTQGDVKEE